VIVRVESINDDRVYTQSGMLSILGRIDLSYPSAAGGQEFYVGVDESIQWTPSGTLPGNQVLISGSTDGFATPENTFNIAIRPAGAGGQLQTYTWDVLTCMPGYTVPISEA